MPSYVHTNAFPLKSANMPWEEKEQGGIKAKFRSTCVYCHCEVWGGNHELVKKNRVSLATLGLSDVDMQEYRRRDQTQKCK